MGANTVLRRSPTTHFQQVALQTAQQCMEWFVGQRHLNGYDAFTCPSTPVSRLVRRQQDLPLTLLLHVRIAAVMLTTKRLQ